MGRTHILLGVTCWTAVGGIDPLPMAAAAFGALLPDMDTPQSTLGRLFFPISLPLSLVVEHRGVTHSLVAAGLVSLVGAMAWRIELFWLAAIAVGYLSHLVGDYLTARGIPALWPLRRRYAFPGAFAVGGFIESIVAIGLVIVLALLIKPDLWVYIDRFANQPLAY